MEMPTVFMFTSSKLQPGKLRMENENNLLVDHLDKTDDVDICTKQRLARVEREVLELREAVIASQSQPKVESIPCHNSSSVKVILLFAYVIISNVYAIFCYFSPLLSIGYKM
jgi:hypothetical protein